MNRNAQIIAIARACPKVARIDGAGVAVWVDDPVSWKGSRDRFEPLEDLNAMHEAVKALNVDEENWMDTWLYTTADKNARHPDGTVLTRTWKATAEQMAEAFLRAIGKWEES